jgi:hypothetical protein
MIVMGFYNYQKICQKALPNTFTTTLELSWLLYFAVYSKNPVIKPRRKQVHLSGEPSKQEIQFGSETDRVLIVNPLLHAQKIYLVISVDL